MQVTSVNMYLISLDLYIYWTVAFWRHNLLKRKDKDNENWKFSDALLLAFANESLYVLGHSTEAEDIEIEAILVKGRWMAILMTVKEFIFKALL
jgi:hypothetical protein